MDWKRFNFDWNHARSFLLTAEKGSFSAAARALRSTQPTIGRQVAALEEEIGVLLFERIGTKLKLTKSGLEFLEQIRAMGAAAAQASIVATQQSESVEGTVSITASEAISCFLLPPVLQKLRRAYPRIQLELVVSNEAQDLQNREADIAIRNFAPKKPDLIARKLRNSEAYFYAAPSYIERVGELNTKEDLKKVSFFSFDAPETMAKQYQQYLGLDVSIEQFSIQTKNHLVMWEMCKQGMGVCLMMKDVGEPEKNVVQVFPDFPSIPIPMWLVCHRELRTSRRLRIVFDWLVEHLTE